MHERVGSDRGFIAALDQSGGSTPRALEAYGIDASNYSNDAEMFDLVHEMRTRIVSAPCFRSDRILGAILFELTMDRKILGMYTGEYLWEHKKIVPFLKVDKGLAAESEGVQLMKANPGLGELLDRARERKIYGTKMRSVINNAVVSGIGAVVGQQFDIGLEILAAGLMPILEPEVSITCPDKAEAEDLMREQIVANLDRVPDGSAIMLKLTLPDIDNFYAELIADRRVHRVVALSGGYSRNAANIKLAQNHGMTASFSRALVEGLTHQQTATHFNQTLDDSIASIYAASIT